MEIEVAYAEGGVYTALLKGAKLIVPKAAI
jgi:hypothetical protein